MFAIFVTEMKSDGRKGWLKGTKMSKLEPSELHSGKQRIELIFAEKRSKVKTWKTGSGAVRFAKTLASRLETVEYVPQKANPYIHLMRYMIQVMNMDTNIVIHTINMYKYEATK